MAVDSNMGANLTIGNVLVHANAFNHLVKRKILTGTINILQATNLIKAIRKTPTLLGKFNYSAEEAAEIRKGFLALKTKNEFRDVAIGIVYKNKLALKTLTDQLNSVYDRLESKVIRNNTANELAERNRLVEMETIKNDNPHFAEFVDKLNLTYEQLTDFEYMESVYNDFLDENDYQGGSLEEDTNDFLGNYTEWEVERMNQQNLIEDSPEEALSAMESVKLIKKIRSEIKDYVFESSYFEDENGDDNDNQELDELQFGTRENGDVGAEEYGMKDLQEGKRMKANIEARWKNVKVDVQTADEWVMLFIKISVEKPNILPIDDAYIVVLEKLNNDKQTLAAQHAKVITPKNVKKWWYGDDNDGFYSVNESEMTQEYIEELSYTDFFEWYDN